MPFVSIIQGKRDPATTRRLISAITDSFVEICGVGPDRVSIHLQDVDAEHWAEAGLLLADRRAAGPSERPERPEPERPEHPGQPRPAERRASR